MPVLLLTAKVGDEAEVEGLDAGADAYVEKPFSMETLRAHIKNLIEPRAALRDQYRDEVTMAPTDVSVTGGKTILRGGPVRSGGAHRRIRIHR